MQAPSTSWDDQVAWATLAALRLPVHPASVLSGLGSPSRLFSSSLLELSALLPWTHRQLERVLEARPEGMARQLERLLQRDTALVTFSDAGYPERLRHISCPPAALWCRGRPAALLGPLVAIVGARQATPYGLEVSRMLATGLAGAGVGVVSGGAVGIDAAAHVGALDADGITVAVHGTGIDVTYPVSHRTLYARIAEQGACMTEFGPGSSARPEHFPIRNRLISGLSLGVVVVEAAEKSGALITTRFALEQNREVFAVPGSIQSPLSVGPHRLLRQGARLVTSVGDILEELRLPGGVPRARERDGGRKEPGAELVGERLPPPLTDAIPELWPRLGTEPRTVDALVESSGRTASEVLDALMLLELEGWVVQHSGQRYARQPGGAAPARAPSPAVQR